jgi:hypothetical protein
VNKKVASYTFAEFDRRIKEYESGETKVFTLEEMVNNARQNYKIKKSKKVKIGSKSKKPL